MQRKSTSPNGPALGERDNVVVLPLPASTSVSQPRVNPGAIIPGRRMRRRKSTVLSADVAGYTRLMEADEEETHERLMWILATFLEPQIAAHRGHVVKHTGDGFLAAFDSVAEGIRCAVGMQRNLLELTRQDSPERRIWFRMGVNVCDAIVEADDLFGDGINVAARLQTYAEPGDIVISQAVAAQLPTGLDTPMADLGDVHLKNMSKPVRAFSLRIGSASQPVITPAPAADELPSIAILPFEDQHRDAPDAYFAEGIVDDIIRALSTLREIFVISRSSTLAYAGKPVDVRTVGRELGVRYVLTGSVRRRPSLVRISTELTDAVSGTIIQAEHYDGDISNLFDFQDQVALRVVAAIAPQVREWELRRALRKRPENMDAYDLTLQGLDLLYRLDYEAFSRARGLLQQAIVHDPTYSAPYAFAAHWHIFRVGQGWSPDPDSDGIEGGRLAATAVELDKQNALALTFHGHTHSFILKQYDVALGYFERALAAGPNCAMAWALSSATHSYLDDGAEAVARAEHALRLSPRDIHAFYYQTALTLAHHACGDYEAAVASGLRAASQNPLFCTNLRHTAASLVALGRLREARDVVQMHIKAQPLFRLSRFAPTCPYKSPERRALFIERLRTAGLPQ